MVTDFIFFFSLSLSLPVQLEHFIHLFFRCLHQQDDGKERNENDREGNEREGSKKERERERKRIKKEEKREKGSQSSIHLHLSLFFSSSLDSLTSLSMEVTKYGLEHNLCTPKKKPANSQTVYRRKERERESIERKREKNERERDNSDS